ncbi:MAG TPA: hypothetical protein VMX38_17875 [Verrucomicrobiae bacterium]|jgi:hypothetical protein|nr:hypothetical protein [Verrucomicrobiae bacterium]
MNFRNMLAAAIVLILGGFAFVPPAHADEWNEQTELSFNQPVELPNTILPAGKYWFILANNDSDRHIVRVFSSDWSKLYATLNAIPVIRREPTNHTEVKFAERRHDQPEALLDWYYPGRFTGNEFVYSHQLERRFRHDPKQEVVAHALTPRS